MYLTPSLSTTSWDIINWFFWSYTKQCNICPNWDLSKSSNLIMLVLTNQNMKKEHAFSLNIQQVFDSMSHVFWYGKLWTKLCMVSIKKKEIIQFFLTNSTDFNIKSNPLQYHTILSLFLHTELFFRQLFALMRIFLHKGKDQAALQQSLYCYLVQARFSAVMLLT